MRQRDLTALGLIAVAAYVFFGRKKSAAPASLDVVSGSAIVGFLDQTQQVQYDPATGNLWDTSGADNVLIATIQPGRDASVFADPTVQQLIQNARYGSVA